MTYMFQWGFDFWKNVSVITPNAGVSRVFLMNGRLFHGVLLEFHHVSLVSIISTMPCFFRDVYDLRTESSSRNWEDEVFGERLHVCFWWTSVLPRCRHWLWVWSAAIQGDEAMANWGKLKQRRFTLDYTFVILALPFTQQLKSNLLKFLLNLLPFIPRYVYHLYPWRSYRFCVRELNYSPVKLVWL